MGPSQGKWSDNIHSPLREWPRGNQGVQSGGRGMDVVGMHMTCQAPLYKLLGVLFHGGPIISGSDSWGFQSLSSGMETTYSIVELVQHVLYFRSRKEFKEGGRKPSFIEISLCRNVMGNSLSVHWTDRLVGILLIHELSNLYPLVLRLRRSCS